MTSAVTTSSTGSLPLSFPAIKYVSEPSEEVFRILADPNISLSSICELVDSNVDPIVNEAQIIESRVYIQRKAPIGPHRKIVLKFRARRGNCFWLMLERKAESRKALLKGLGSTHRKDQGQLSHENPSDLIDGNMYELDNTQVFNGTVTLNELRLVSQAMGEILVRYKLFSVNCWSFCSILQHELGWQTAPFYQYGSALEHKMYAAARKEIHHRVQELNYIIDPMMLPAMLESLSQDAQLSWETSKRLSTLKTCFTEWLAAGDPHSSTRIDITPLLLESVDSILYPPAIDEANIVCAQVIMVLRRSAKVAPEVYHSFLSQALRMYGDLLRQTKAPLDAASIGEEAVGIKRSLHHSDPTAHSSDLSKCLESLKYTLNCLDNARLSQELALETFRILKDNYRANPTPDRLQELAMYIDNLSINRHNIPTSHLVTSMEEIVLLAREHPDWYSDSMDAALLPFTLSSFGNLLRLVGDHERACVAYREAWDFWQVSELEESENDTRTVARTLQSLSRSLDTLGRYDEAHSALQKAVKLHQQLYDEDPDTFALEFCTALRELGGFLKDHGKLPRSPAVEVAGIAVLRQFVTSEPDVDHHPDSSRSHYCSEHLPTSDDDTEMDDGESYFPDTPESECSDDDGPNYTVNLGLSLYHYAFTLRRLGRAREALQVIEEAIEFLKWEFEDLARARHERGLILLSLRRHAQARAAFEEASEVGLARVGQVRELFASQPNNTWRNYLAGAVHVCSISLIGCGRLEEAGALYGESITLGYQPNNVEKSTWIELGGAGGYREIC